MRPELLLGKPYRLGATFDLHQAGDCIGLAREVLKFYGIKSPQPTRDWYRRVRRNDYSILPKHYAKIQMSDSKMFIYNDYGYNSNNSIAIIWSVEDVQQVVEDYELKVRLTHDECMEVLTYMERKADCNYGVCWENIYDAILYVHEEKFPKEKKG